MKNKFPILVCMAALSLWVLPLGRAESEPKPYNPVEGRFREMDLNLALHQYERVQMEIFDSRLKLDLLETEGDLTPAERDKKAKLIERRIAILRQMADELRATAYKIGEQAIKAR